MTNQITTPGTSPRFDKTIAALASGQSGAAISLIRISGDDAFAFSLSGLDLPKTPPKPRHAYYANFTDPKNNEVIDDVVAIFYAGPNSYTGEDLVEISCHGSPYIVQRVLKCLYDLGCVAAEPGEYTRRAFLNGRMDLTKAEGIKELVEAQSSGQWYAARQLASGRLSEEIEKLRKKIIEASAYLEAQIDFPDEGDTAGINLTHVIPRVEAVKLSCDQLLASYQSGRISLNGPSVVIIGPPNAGKSTLLNALLEKDRAIVTDIAGTTRDYIEEGCLVQGRYIRLFDTAGIREDAEVIEKIGIEQARILAGKADLVLFLAPADQAEPEWDDILNLSAEGSAFQTIKVLTKSDLANPSWSREMLKISCHKEGGLNPLKDEIVKFVDSHVAQIREVSFITSARHAHALESARESLNQFLSLSESSESVECLAFELQAVIRSLQSIIGHVHNEDILDKIFSDFCVGK